jgi:hypothetical protein
MAACCLALPALQIALPKLRYPAFVNAGAAAVLLVLLLLLLLLLLPHPAMTSESPASASSDLYPPSMLRTGVSLEFAVKATQTYQPRQARKSTRSARATGPSRPRIGNASLDRSRAQSGQPSSRRRLSPPDKRPWVRETSSDRFPFPIEPAVSRPACSPTPAVATFGGIPLTSR